LHTPSNASPIARVVSGSKTLNSEMMEADIGRYPVISNTLSNERVGWLEVAREYDAHVQFVLDQVRAEFPHLTETEIANLLALTSTCETLASVPRPSLLRWRARSADAESRRGRRGGGRAKG
jgi:hypothetical protein